MEKLLSIEKSHSLTNVNKHIRNTQHDRILTRWNSKNPIRDLSYHWSRIQNFSMTWQQRRKSRKNLIHDLIAYKYMNRKLHPFTSLHASYAILSTSSRAPFLIYSRKKKGWNKNKQPESQLFCLMMMRSRHENIRSLELEMFKQRMRKTWLSSRSFFRYYVFFSALREAF